MSSEQPIQTRAWLGLGSNQGNRLQLLRRTLELLRDHGVPPSNCSSVYETDPLDYLSQPMFLNMVCSVPARLDPPRLLVICKEIELLLGRRLTLPKGPRLIDLDILFHGSTILSSEQLTIPHPALRERRFVLEPLAEVAPGMIDPVSGKSIRELLDHCPDRGKVRIFHPPLCDRQ